MKSILAKLLFNNHPPSIIPGRQVKFGIEEPDIVISTGPLDERISTLLCHRGYPMTAREIATGINSNTSQVNRGLRQLVADGRAAAIDIPGSVKEYTLI